MSRPPVVAIVLGIALVVLAWSTIAYHDATEESDARRFLDSVRPSLMTRFGTVDQARAAGYLQLTHLGWDGTEIYFNNSFIGVGPLTPNFLWYDRHGRLVGIDYELPIAQYPMNPPGRELFPVKRERWSIVYAHVHLAYDLDGKTVLQEADAQPKLAFVTVPKQTLHDAGLLPMNAQLLWFSYHPRCWDLALWLTPNPFGASADYNPYVYF
jgi:hypothetical protein